MFLLLDIISALQRQSTWSYRISNQLVFRSFWPTLIDLPIFWFRCICSNMQINISGLLDSFLLCDIKFYSVWKYTETVFIFTWLCLAGFWVKQEWCHLERIHCCWWHQVERWSLLNTRWQNYMYNWIPCLVIKCPTKLQTCNCHLFICQKDIVTLTHLRVKDYHNASPFLPWIINGTLYAYSYTCQA